MKLWCSILILTFLNAEHHALFGKAPHENVDVAFPLANARMNIGSSQWRIWAFGRSNKEVLLCRRQGFDTTVIEVDVQPTVNLVLYGIKQRF